MISPFNQIYNEIPSDFEDLLKGLGKGFSLNIAFLLLRNGALSLSKVAEFTKKENSFLLNYLRKLELAGFVQNFLQKKAGTREFSFYELTAYGTCVLEGLTNLYNNHYGMDEKLEKGDRVPEDLEANLDAISNKLRFSLALVISEKPISFTNLVKITNKIKSRIAIELKKLEVGGIVQNFLKKDQESNEYSFYELTRWGNKLVFGLKEMYDQFYMGNKKALEIKDKVPQTEYFGVKAAKWALPNEKILAWIEVFSDEINELIIFPLGDLIIKSFYSTTPKIDEKNNQYFLDLTDKNLKYIPFELNSKIPETETSINEENLIVKAFDKNHKQIAQKKLTIEIMKPIVKLKVNKKNISKEKGFFEIAFSFSNNIQISIPGMEIKVTDKHNNPIKIIFGKKDPVEIEQELPPGVELENVCGEFQIKERGIYIFYFRIPYKDILGNQYYSNEEIVTLDNAQSFIGNFSYCIETAESKATG